MASHEDKCGVAVTPNWFRCQSHINLQQDAFRHSGRRSPLQGSSGQSCHSHGSVSPTFDFNLLFVLTGVSRWRHRHRRGDV